jgi:hypothetical protein
MKQSFVGLIIFVISIDLCAKDMMIEPDSFHCRQYEGVIGSEGKCVAYVSDAEKICKSIGAKLPSVNYLSSVTSNCGGVFENVLHNNNDTEYATCIQNKGYVKSDNCSYLTSTKNGGSTMLYDMGKGSVRNISAFDKMHFVICIKK